ncbi:creC [Candida theae]|uniref:CreC n=1 Tax=Candida theae TaxID=1198502 RepID=A0AAD5G0R5_9ASCO|nr:creC [Candida theae]KAI5967610.1 creC [Candida theae]
MIQNPSNTTETPLANVSLYLNSVCPGYTQLEENVHHNLPNDIAESTWGVSWPIANGKSINAKLKLEKQYLNVARPPMGPFESTTYVSLPLHVVNSFKEKVHRCDKRQEGNLHIGANVNPLTQDPFRNPNTNPGALTTILETRTRFQSKNPFNKLTSNLNKLFVKDDFYENVESSGVSILSYNDDFASCGKLLISGNINVLNVFGLSESSEYEHTKEVGSHKEQLKIEQPLLRLQFSNTCIITSLVAFVLNDEPIIVFGCNLGRVSIIKPRSMKIKSIDLNLNTSEHSLNMINVSTVQVIRHPLYEYLIVAGTSNGEVFILNPFGRNELRNYKKEVVETDSYVTYFRKFDLSIFGHATDDQLIGHFKLCHKSITAIASTLPVEGSSQTDSQPLLLAIASEDGFVKIVDLMFTYRIDQEEIANSIVTDIVPNYFNSGVSDVRFSPDFKFFTIVGKGDLIEVFKMTYYNITGLLKKSERPQARSRSGTVNSHNSHYNGMAATHSLQSLQNLQELHPEKGYPPVIKSVEIVCRLKGHTNSVKSIQFLKGNCDDSSLVYKLVSCGNDGKVFAWEFDYKAIPRVKKPHAATQSKPRESRRSIHEKKNGIQIVTQSPSPGPVHSRSSHRRNLSSDPILNTPSFTNLLSTKSLNLTSVLSDDHSPKSQAIEAVVSLYKQLLDVRIKKSSNKTFIQGSTIISPIVNDKYLPSISIPLATIDLASVVPDGKIDNVFIDNQTVWCFCKNGDLFKYKVHIE